MYFIDLAMFILWNSMASAFLYYLQIIRKNKEYLTDAKVFQYR